MQEDINIEEYVPLSPAYATQTIDSTEMQEVIKEHHESKLWPKFAIDGLILKYEDVYVDINHGNLGKKHWHKVATVVNLG